MEQFRPGGYKILPDVIKNLLIINGLFFLAQMTFETVYNIKLEDLLGLRYVGSEAFKPYQIITYMFLHGDFGHLFFNMFALWMFGAAMENHWGSKKFLIYYIITCIVAAIVHYAVIYFQIMPSLNEVNQLISNPSMDNFNAFMASSNFEIRSYEMQEHLRQALKVVQKASLPEVKQSIIDFASIYKTEFLNAPNVIGASGAVYGLLLAFGMTFPNSYIYIYMIFPLKAKYFVIIYGAIELYLGVSNNANSNIAHFAHLGGMLFGVLLILYWRKKNKNY